MSDTNLARFRAAVAAGLAHLESRRQEVNDLNVFPVADGDTGDNMALTLRAVLDELDRLQGSNGGARTIDEIGREEIVQSVTRAALLGARGNSGVILSQLIRGAAEELVSRPGELVDPTLIGAALAHGADRAYASVREPAEGTILTAARAMASRIATDVAHAPGSPRLGADADARVQDLAIASTLEAAVEAGQDAVKRGPDLLAVLREAGVVDAGAYALTVIVAGVVAALRGDEPPDLDHHAPARVTHPEHSSSTYRYCTNFAVTGRALSPGRFITALEAIGDSVLVVGDSVTLKVHLHTDRPGAAAAVFEGVGELCRFDVADMRVQVSERAARLSGSAPRNGPARGGSDGRGSQNGPAPGERDGGAPPNGPARGWGEARASPDARAAGTSDGGAAHEGRRAWTSDGRGRARGGESGPGRPGAPASVRCRAVAAVSGDGVAGLLEELGVLAVDGGPTLNPSTYELLAGIHEAGAEEVVVLPCSPNVVMAAERAAELSEKQIAVVAATSQQAGLVAALAMDSQRGLQENVRAMERALEGLRTGAVAPAARADAQGRFAPGDAVGFIGEQVVAWGEPAATLRAVLRGLGDGAELLTVLAGEDPPLELHELEPLLGGELSAELELRHGGQPTYWWLLAAE
ncbi:MAG: DAK2 domain-containing protein [Solirubrobacterales bacterium]|nr:DAK2 domain-containing protein [Solirubrobacterales bacterium]